MQILEPSGKTPIPMKRSQIPPILASEGLLRAIERAARKSGLKRAPWIRATLAAAAGYKFRKEDS